MTEPYARQTQVSENEREGEVSAAVEEVIAEFGVKAFLAAALRDGRGEACGMGGDSTLRFAQVLIRRIVFSDDPQLEAEVMALGAGILLNDEMTQTRIAEKHGLGRAAISKRVISFTEEMRLPPSQFMKSVESRKTFALTNQPRIA